MLDCEVMSESTVQISGKKLRILRVRKPLTQAEIGAAMGVSETRVRQIERSDKVGVYPKTFRALAEALGMSADVLREKLHTDGATLEVAKKDDWDQNVEPYSELRVPEIPLFEIPLAAGNWVDPEDMGEVCDPRQMEHGLFRVRIRGDSMEPVWKDGEVVEFKCLRVDRDDIEVGKDYYVQRSDGCATFKRVESLDEETMVLRPLNKKKYPKPMPVERALVVRMAKALHALVYK